MRLADKVAVITGGASGIGRAACELFAREGARVLVADVKGERAAEVARDINRKGGAAQAIGADISKEPGAERIVSRALELWGRLDILVNNAATFIHKRVEDATREDWLAAVDVNVIGTALCSKHAVAAMRKQGRGSIVNVASINGLVAMPNWVTYNATKAAIVNMSKSMALDLGPYNIRVNCLCPGITRTPALDVVLAEMGLSVPEAEKIFAEPRAIIKRFGTAEEIAPAILFLASDEASYMTGATVVVDGGFTT